MLDVIEKRIQEAFSSHILVRYGLSVPIVIEQPKNPAFGELAVPIAFQLAKDLKRAPKQIAAELVDDLGQIEGVAALEMAGSGYINVRLNRSLVARSLLQPATSPAGRNDGKIIVEHTNINPNKAAHIGHLRNAILGDTFVRMLRSRGNPVEVQNYIDNTGVQVADVVAGFHYLEKKSLDEVVRLTQDPNVRFDYVCWDSYARISAHFKEHEEALAWRTEALHAIEAGEGELARMADQIGRASCRERV